ncbi:MAG: porin [Nannocystaceae bacterium]
MTGWAVRNRHPADAQTGREGLRHGFFLRQARLNARLQFNRRLRAKISVDLADALGSPERVAFLRDAWANIKIRRAFQIRAGRLKRPFSRLERRGSSKLPFHGRGLFNALAIEQLAWGDRTVGVMLWGDVKTANLRWQAMASNPGPGSEGVDAIARIEYEPTNWLSLGANGGYKNLENAAQDRLSVFAGGGDLRLRVGDLYAAAEFDAAQDWTYDPQQREAPWTLGAVGYVNYNFHVSESTTLQPIVVAEWADSDTSFLQSESLRVVLGFNLLWTDNLRVMPQIELVRPLGTVSEYSRWVQEETYSLLLSLQM